MVREREGKEGGNEAATHEFNRNDAIRRRKIILTEKFGTVPRELAEKMGLKDISGVKRRRGKRKKRKS